MKTLARVFGACSARRVNGEVISVIDRMWVGEGEVWRGVLRGPLIIHL